MRALGRSGISVPSLCIGGNVFGWTVGEATGFHLLDTFFDAGLNFIDTADVYSTWIQKPGISEEIIGRWMKSRGNREKVVVATKVGKPMGEDKKGLSRKYILSAVEASLSRLQTDYIDLYQSHDDDPETPLEETLSTYAELIGQGKVRAIGASNYSGSRLQEAIDVSKENGWPRYESLQPKYNLYDRQEFESTLAPIVVDEEIGVIPYFGLASGFLTGKYRNEADLAQSVRGKGVAKYLNDRGSKILAALDNVAKEVSANPAQVALAWLKHRPGITAPIASATNVNQANDLIASTKLMLSKEAMGQLNQASEA